MSAATTTPAGEANAAARRRLVNASTGKRLVARLIDAVILVVVGAATAVIAAAQGPDGAVTPVVVVGSAVALLVVLVQWWWEATRGRTVGGVTVGIRTVDAREAAPGWWRVLVRTAIVVVAGIVPVIGPLLVTVSNVWDRDRQRQGWHDKAAGTWVVDATLGRDPLAGNAADRGRTAGRRGDDRGTADGGGSVDRTAAGDHGRASSAAAAVPAGSSPVSVNTAPTAADAGSETSTGAAAYRTHASSIDLGVSLAAPGTSTPGSSAPVTAQRAAVAPAAPTAPSAGDDDLEQTRMARPRSTAWRLAFDDGSALTLRGEALVGRNPVNAPEEGDVLLVNLPDPGRSISKTHAHLSAHAEGVWVTDRRSTNGTAVTPPNGDRTTADPGVPVLAVDGALVHLGDRTIAVSRT
ncbi:RDD family protein [Tersicoccus sp. MR15.9]|uniref:RDD family protein n=1 Tax=Tersicoccus mangrovi TaxID=3121635 RepID=UPI002FE5AD36